MSRHSIQNVIRQARGARNAAARTEIRYAKKPLTSYWLREAMRHFNDAEAALEQALGVLRAGRRMRRKMRRAA